MTKVELLDKMQTVHRQLERYIFYFEKGEDGVFQASQRPKFGKKEMEQPGVVDQWSLKDLIAHLSEWERKFIEWYQAGKRGEIPETPAPGYTWKQLDEVNQQIYEMHHQRPLGEILAEFQGSYERMMAVVEDISAGELFEPGYYDWTGKANLAEYLAGCGYEHYDWAKEHIRKWKKRHAGEQLNKEAVLKRIRVERRRLEKNLSELEPEQMIEPGVIGHWSVKDILAHLVDWEQRILGWYRAGLRGEIPETPAPGSTWSRDDMDALNQRIYEKYRDRSLEQVLEDFESSYQETYETVESILESDMFEPGRFKWTGRGNLVGYILANTANHYRWAKTAIRKWVRSDPAGFNQ
jgi:hypothetical protein